MHAAFNATVPLTWGLDPTWVWQARAVVLAGFAAIVIAGSKLYRRVSSGSPERAVDQAWRVSRY